MEAMERIDYNTVMELIGKDVMKPILKDVS
jgi:hypothetical protein